MCSLEGDFSFKGPEKWHFTGVLTRMHRNNGYGLLKAKIKGFTEEAVCLGVPTHLTAQPETCAQVTP